MVEKAGRTPYAVVVKSALDEARRRGNRRLGTEHLLLGLLHVPDSAPARALGVDLETARAALDELDRAALRVLGLDLDLPRNAPPARHPPVTIGAVTSNAKGVLHRSVQATTRKTRKAAPSFLLVELLRREHPDPVADLVAGLELDRAAVAEALAEYEPEVRGLAR
ncbi:Clp protease N-terminal domain-containing protein [Amycolatopsis minnesotensis]|uniref:Clp protease N-terminal domain-containing protein n=1 Tax=Amycolatopsis minnesotensis TaxID=337894 RepID=A0ABP5BZJ0_9PSEU